MDIMTGLSALSQAVGIAKELKELERDTDEATFKLKIAELTSALADAKISLSDANLQINEQSEKLRHLESEIDKLKNGDFCPKCRDGRLELISSTRMMYGGLGNYGVLEQIFECDVENCDFSVNRVVDPQGLVPKFVNKI